LWAEVFTVENSFMRLLFLKRNSFTRVWRWGSRVRSMKGRAKNPNRMNSDQYEGCQQQEDDHPVNAERDSLSRRIMEQTVTFSRKVTIVQRVVLLFSATPEWRVILNGRCDLVPVSVPGEWFYLRPSVLVWTFFASLYELTVVRRRWRKFDVPWL
jgi:hypothetical protein